MKAYEFWDELNDFNWRGHESDDPAVWRGAAEHEKLLRQTAALSTDHAALLKAFEDYVFRGGLKPPRPGS